MDWYPKFTILNCTNSPIILDILLTKWVGSNSLLLNAQHSALTQITSWCLKPYLDFPTAIFPVSNEHYGLLSQSDRNTVSILQNCDQTACLITQCAFLANIWSVNMAGLSIWCVSWSAVTPLHITIFLKSCFPFPLFRYIAPFTFSTQNVQMGAITTANITTVFGVALYVKWGISPHVQLANNDHNSDILKYHLKRLLSTKPN